MALWLVVCVGGLVALGASADAKDSRCSSHLKAPQRIEDTISRCQNEIKLAILEEVLGELNVKQAAEQLANREHLTNSEQLATNAGHTVRGKRSAFDEDERRIAGCLLHCVYRKVKAIDSDGFPTPEGLVRLYTEGVDEKGYYNATATGAQLCIAEAYESASTSTNGRTLCDVAYDTFECLTNRLDAYCSGED